MGEFLTLLQSVWALVMQQPWPFVALAVALFGIGWALGRFMYRERIETLKGQIDNLKGRIESYKEKLDGATPDEAKRRLDALEAQLKTMEPRRLSAEQVRTINSRISGHHGLVDVGHDMAVADARLLANDFTAAIQQAGWTVIPSMIMGIGHPPVSGVALLVRDPMALRPLESLFKDALTAVGIKFDVLPGLRSDVAAMGQEPRSPDVGLLFTSRLAA